jgi:hypothetical protein
MAVKWVERLARMKAERMVTAMAALRVDSMAD